MIARTISKAWAPCSAGRALIGARALGPERLDARSAGAARAGRERAVRLRGADRRSGSPAPGALSRLVDGLLWDQFGRAGSAGRCRG